MTNPILETRMGCTHEAMDIQKQCRDLSAALAALLKSATEKPAAAGFAEDGLRKIKDAEAHATQAFRELRAVVEILADQG